MKMALFIAFALFLIGVLSGLAWRRAKNRGQKADLVAKSNHKSVWSFHYGPSSAVSIREMAKASPRPAADSPLTQLIAEDIDAKEQQAKAEKAARDEPTQSREHHGPQQPNEQPDKNDSAAAEIAVSSTAAKTSNGENGPAPETSAAPLLSSRHAPGPKVNVLDMLGTDEAAAIGQAPAAAEVKPAAGEEPTLSVTVATEDDTVPQTLYANALTEATRTKNDEANRKAAVALKQRKRAALRTGTDGQKTALAALITEATAPR